MFIYSKLPQSISAEAYKSIRTSLKFASVDNKLKTIVITSSVPGEGKSTITGNLALCLSEAGSRVLIIDCDLRKPSIHKKFSCSNLSGLTDVLINGELLKDALYEYRPRLTILSSGSIPPNPSEILSSQTFERFLKNISLDYDYVIIDSPPLLAVTDARILAAKSDGTILIVKQGKTKEKQILRAYDELKSVNARIIGSILNVCDNDRKNVYYRYYQEKNRVIKKKQKKEKNKAANESKRHNYTSVVIG